MKRFLKIATVSLLLLLVLCALAACNEQEYTVRFDAADGTAMTECKVTEGGFVAEPTAPTKEGYTFAGWYNGDEKWSFKDAAVTADVDLKARWEAISYTLELSLGGGTVEGEYADRFTVESDAITVPNPTKVGYTFAGWTFEGVTEPVKDLVIAKGTLGNKKLTAVWQVVEFEITVELGGGTASGTYPTDYTVEDGVISFADPVRDGYTFSGWSVDGSADLVKNLSFSADEMKNKTLTAVWEVIEFEITVNLGGGTAVGSYPTDYTVEDGVISFADPVRDGYTFSGWSVDGSDDLVKDLSFNTNELKNKTLTAVWVVVRFEITINLGGGTAGGTYPTDYTVEDGVISLADPVRDGYTFSGWSIDGSADLVKNLSFNASEMKEKTLTAVWVVIEFEITVNLNGGTAGGTYPTDYTVEDGVISFADPVRDGYTFSGWSVDGSADLVKDLSFNASEMKDKSLTAVWVVIRFTITVKLNGGTASGEYLTEYTVEDGAITIENPTRPHYEFDGWSVNGSSAYVKDLIIDPTDAENKELEAIFSPTKYTIVYHDCDSIGENKTTYTVLDEITLKAPTKAGHTFVCWYLDEAKTETVTKIELGTSGELHLWADWTVDEYEITYELDGGTVEGENPTSYTVKDSVTLLSPTKEGYTFVAWLLNGEQVAGIPVGTTGNVTLTAVFKLREYAITYELDGGVNAGENPTFLNAESEFTFAAPAKEGYTFVGWFADEACTVSCAGVLKGTTKELTVYAKWTPTPYEITVELSGGTLDTDIPDTYTIESGEIVLPIPVREFYDFSHWLVNGSEATSIPAGFFGDVTLTAVFTPTKYAITYMLGGGKNNADNPLTYTVLDRVTLAAPTKAGYTFGGWYSDAEMTVSAATFGPDKSGEVTVYAKWTPISYTITYHLYGGTNAEGNKTTFTVEDLPLRLADATKYDLFFDAWYTEADYENAVYVITELKNIELHAKFVPATEGVNYTLSEDGTHYIVTGYEGTDTKVIIAAMHDSLPVLKIAAYAFQSASTVTEIVVPASVTTIEQNALNGCTALEKLTVPFVGGSATSNRYLGYIFGAGTYNNNSSYVPSTLTRVTVTACDLASYAFYKCTSIEEIELRAPLTVLPEYVFANCKGLKSFEIPATVTTIEQNVFLNCSALSTLYIPETVTTIKNYAFQNCDNTVIYIAAASAPEGYGEDAFYDVNRYYYNATTVTGETDGLTWLLLRDDTLVITGYTGTLPTTLAIPAQIDGRTVVAIGKCAFRNAYELTRVTFPDTLKLIDEEAFTYAGITELVIPASVLHIGKNAFWNCSQLLSLEVHAKFIGYSAFGALDRLETLIIGEGVEVLDDGAFRRAYALKSVSLPSSIVSIGKGTFEYANKLTSITLPFIGASRDATDFRAVFGYIFGYTESSSSSSSSGVLQYQGYNEYNNYRYFYYRIPTTLTEVTVTNCTTVPEMAFKGCNNIKKLTVTCDLESFGQAFYQSTGLEEVVFTGKVGKIADSAFYHCTALKSVTLSGVEEIGTYVFYNCSSLQSIDLTGVKTIGEYAFANSNMLASITFGEGLETIGNYAFAWLDSLQEIKLPDSLQSIGEHAFYDSGATKIDLGGGVKTIGAQAFYSSNNLKEVYLPDTVTYIGEWGFAYCDKATLYMSHSEEPAGWGTNWSNGVLAIVWNYAGVRGTTDDGFDWVLDKSGHVTITGYHGSGLTEVTIPATIEGYSVTTLGTRFFENKDSAITKVTVPAGVTHIGERAFANNYSLKEVVLPDTVTHIGDYAFSSCQEMVISISSSLEYIGERAFAYCYKLTELALPDTLKHIGFGAFNGCNNLAKLTLPFIGATPDGTENRHFAYIFGATDKTSPGSLVPSTLKTLVLNTDNVPAHAFYYISGVTDVTFTKTVKTIGEYAFYDCTSLENLTLPKGVETIGVAAFSGTTALKSFDFSTVITIGNDAFSRAGIESVSFSDALLSIGGSAFSNAAFSGVLTVPAGVTSIGSYAFEYTNIKEAVLLCEVSAVLNGTFRYCASLERVTLSPSTATISSYAFDNCISLKSFDFSHVTSVLDYAFRYCEALESVSLDAVETLYSYAFYRCKSLSKIDFGSKLKSIGAYTFFECTALSQLDLGDVLETVGNYAFQNCSSLVKVRLGKSVKTIGSQAFYNCTKLYDVCNDSTLKLSAGNTTNGYVVYYAKNVYSSTSGSPCITTVGDFMLMTHDGEVMLVAYTGKGGDVTVPATVTRIDIGTFAGCTALTSVKLPTGLKSIGERAFENCTGITMLEIPAGVTRMGSSAFAGCTSLEAITLPFAGLDRSYDDYSNHVGYLFGAVSADATSGLHAPKSLKHITILGGEHLPKYAFNRFYDVESITLPSTIKTVGASAFSMCSSLTEITLPDSVTEMGTNVFYYCEKLTAVTLPSGMTSIPESTFVYCSALKGISIPSGVTSISQYAFQYAGLETVSLPTGLLTIGGAAFANCTLLTEIVIPDSVTSIAQSAFNNCSSMTAITVPFIGDGTTAKTYFGWIFGASSYSNNKIVPASLRHVTVTGGSVAAYAFYNCYYLESVTLPSGMTSIPDYLFYGCYGLKDIEIQDTVKTIGTYAFQSCSGLTEIELPEGLTAIGNSAFNGCYDLKMIVIPAAVATMGSSVFDSYSEILICVEAEVQPSGWDSRWLSNFYADAVVMWGATKVTYTFVTNGGTACDAIYDYAVVTLPRTKKAGYYFGGWFDNADFTGDPIEDTYHSTEKTTLYARWLTEEGYRSWSNGTSEARAYILTLDTIQSSSHSTTWCRYTASEEMTLTVYFSDNNYRANSKKLYVYDEDGNLLVAYEPTSVYSISVKVEVKAGQTIYVKAVEGSYANQTNVNVYQSQS